MRCCIIWHMNEGWKSWSVRCTQATKSLRCQTFANRWTNSNAGLLKDPAGHFFLEACSVMLRLGHPGEELSLLWLVFAFAPTRAELFPPRRGDLSYMRVVTHPERLKVMLRGVPRLTSSRRTCPLVLHYSQLVAGPSSWCCWGRWPVCLWAQKQEQG